MHRRRKKLKLSGIRVSRNGFIKRDETFFRDTAKMVLRGNQRLTLSRPHT